MTEEELESLESLRGSLGIAVSHLNATLASSAMVAAEGQESAFQHEMHELKILHRLLAKRRDEVQELIHRYKEEFASSPGRPANISTASGLVGATVDTRL